MLQEQSFTKKTSFLDGINWPTLLSDILNMSNDFIYLVVPSSWKLPSCGIGGKTGRRSETFKW